ncbi:molybdenum cofactor biosynthesis protein A [Stieleria varia]|uniref:Molybdenum cofactor biosynthesis protein A n=2 Tax=Stieleria varia TaxID=2528005 RepID=A0A5C6B3S8_9BACT|nr:molybdenum cofactor biosynthesis protein A [Stieleria varia]
MHQDEEGNAAIEREILEGVSPGRSMPLFRQKIRECGIDGLKATGIEILQINVGKVCNQTCTHCHVNAGPTRRESMSRKTAEAVIDVLSRTGIPTLDITGGAPEMNPNFRWLVEQAHALGRRIIDRCNLTILVAGGFRDLPEFLAEHNVEVVASLPCYLEENCDSQRGDGVFRRSIEALRRLNSLGYGLPRSEHKLSLVYNPIGLSLPPRQEQLEADYRRELRTRYGIEFTHLQTITNLPISRFLDDLLKQDRLDEYLQLLIDNFNVATVGGLMCRTMISVDWQGRLFDCDFNQMLDLELSGQCPRTIHDFDFGKLANRAIKTGRHCFGCTAGCGSSCQGAILAGGESPVTNIQY